MFTTMSSHHVSLTLVQIKLENRIEIETYFFFVQFLPALTASSNTALRPSPVLAEHSINLKKKTKRKYYEI